MNKKDFANLITEEHTNTLKYIRDNVETFSDTFVIEIAKTMGLCRDCYFTLDREEYRSFSPGRFTKKEFKKAIDIFMKEVQDTDTIKIETSYMHIAYKMPGEMKDRSVLNLAIKAWIDDIILNNMFRQDLIWCFIKLKELCNLKG